MSTRFYGTDLTDAVCAWVVQALPTARFSNGARAFYIGSTRKDFRPLLFCLGTLGPNVPFPLAELFALGASPKDQASFDLWTGPSTSARLGEAPTLTCAPQAA
jgi:hypothetical protein